ncbi:hypothetical protein VNO80_05635 [Phaseolus coccineus]|uniref:Uncharacterized protein n=1 Tax=Phaseolus coccineus TaxID=3886 RepID=A0AAN9RDV3_PHACN
MWIYSNFACLADIISNVGDGQGNPQYLPQLLDLLYIVKLSEILESFLSRLTQVLAHQKLLQNIGIVSRLIRVAPNFAENEKIRDVKCYFRSTFGCYDVYGSSNQIGSKFCLRMGK